MGFRGENDNINAHMHSITSTGGRGQCRWWLGSCSTYNIPGYPTFVRATLNALGPPFLPLHVDTRVPSTILYTPFTGTSIIAALAGFSTICALLERINSLFQKDKEIIILTAIFTCLRLVRSVIYKLSIKCQNASRRVASNTSESSCLFCFVFLTIYINFNLKFNFFSTTSLITSTTKLSAHLYWYDELLPSTFPTVYQWIFHRHSPLL
jgi:hypothetical protein